MKEELPLDQLSLDQILALMKRNIKANLEFAKRVYNNDSESVKFFFVYFSEPILEYIGKNVYRVMPVPYEYVNRKTGERSKKLSYAVPLTSEYFEFVACSNDTGELVQDWKKVKQYKGINDKGIYSLLYTYINRITINHFNKEAEKAKKKNSNLYSMDDEENRIMATLMDYEGFDIIDNEIMGEERMEVINAVWDELNERDQTVLNYLCKDDCKPIDVFDEMVEYMDAKTDCDTWDDTIKQRKLSQMKIRAQKHLAKLVYNYQKERGIDLGLKTKA